MTRGRSKPAASALRIPWRPDSALARSLRRGIPALHELPVSGRPRYRPERNDLLQEPKLFLGLVQHGPQVMGREGVQHREVGALGRSLVVRRETLGRQYADDHHAGPELPAFAMKPRGRGRAG